MKRKLLKITTWLLRNGVVLTSTLFTGCLVSGGWTGSHSNASSATSVASASGSVPACVKCDESSRAHKIRLAAFSPNETDASNMPVQDSIVVPLSSSSSVPTDEPTAARPSILQSDSANSLEPALDVEYFVQLAMATHPKIAAARERVAAAQQRLTLAAALPDPTVETTFWPIQANSLQTAGGRMTDQIGLSQQLPHLQKRRAKCAIADREVQMAQAEVEQIQLEIAESVRLAYYELWFADKAIEIVSQNRELAGQLIKAAEGRYRAGGSQQDVIRAGLEADKLEQQLLELGRQRLAAQADLTALVPGTRTEDLPPKPTLELDSVPQQLDALINQAQQSNPELQGLAWQIQRDQQRRRLACLQQYPDATAGVQYGFMSTGGSISPVADGTDMLSFTVGLTLPIWRDKIRAGICEAAAQHASSTQLLESEKLEVAGRLRRLLAEADSLDQQIRLYEDRISPKAEQALKVAAAEYTVGKTSFAELLGDYSELLVLQLQTARLKASLAGTLAQIRRTAGRL